MSAVLSFPWALFFSRVRKQLLWHGMKPLIPEVLLGIRQNYGLKLIGNGFDKFASIYILTVRFQTVIDPMVVGFYPLSRRFSPRDGVFL